MEKKSLTGEVCEVCDGEGEIRCTECKNIHIYCKTCFDLSHRSPAKKTHRPKPITQEMAKISSELALQMYKCEMHQLEAKKYICKECKEPTCADCFVIGTHVGHTPRAFEEVVHEIIMAFTQELEATKKTHSRARALEANLEDERSREQSAYEAYIAGISEKFLIIQRMLNEKMDELLKIVKKQAQHIDSLLQELSQQAKEVRIRVEGRVAFLRDTIENIKKSINPDNFIHYRDIKPEQENVLSDNQLMDLQRFIDINDRYKIPPAIGLEPIAQAVEELEFEPNRKLLVNIQYTSELKELSLEFPKTTTEDNGAEEEKNIL